MRGEIKWTPTEYYACPHCGSQNPDGGDTCGNCEENPFKLPKKDDLLTKEQLKTLHAVTRQKR